MYILSYFIVINKFVINTQRGQTLTKNTVPETKVDDKPLRKFTFKAVAKNGIQCIFNADGIDVLEATQKAVAFADEKEWDFIGRVVSRQSAYDRAAKEN